MEDFPTPFGDGACVTIGNFDGVHLGHRELIRRALKEAENENLNFILVTFRPHPRVALGKPHQPILTKEDRDALLREAGVRDILEIPFTKELANLSAEAFTREYLTPLNPKKIVVGHDFCLGRNREGNVARLRELGESGNFRVEQIRPVLLEGEPVSSTRLRDALKRGEVERAARLLGRPYKLCGEVTRGEGRGGPLGYPTANLDQTETVVPGDGVYATVAVTPSGEYEAVTNVGFNPTFKGKKRTVETFLLDRDENLYGRPLCLKFVARLRSEKTFPSPEALKKQIAGDVAKAREILAREKSA